MNNIQRIQLATQSLKGVSIGDAFGESFFGEKAVISKHVQNRIIPSTSWEFTDDTVMSIAVFEQLERFGTIQPNDLASSFVEKHRLDPNRGYGATARSVLRAIEAGQPWREIAQNVFDSMGSMGNGAAMRASPIGAYFYDDLEKVKTLAQQSAEITHANIEGIAGAMAVAVATAIATNAKINKQTISPNEFIKQVADALPTTDLKAKIQKSIQIPLSYHIETVRSILGNGIKMLAQDTVPFAIWCAAHHQHHFENALWKAVSILGDRDTICAIVGRITVMSASGNTIPQTWLNAVEDVENSIFRAKIDKT